MSELPVPNLDDRTFEQLVAEAQVRLRHHLPELTTIAPGDPLHSLVDLFAWFTESIIYRANLIPERQRRVFLNLLQIPLRPALASRGLVCIDMLQNGPLPPLVEKGATFKGGAFATDMEVQPTPLTLAVAAKRRVDPSQLGELGFTLQELADHYGVADPQPFEPKLFALGAEPLTLAETLDNTYYLALLGYRNAELGMLRNGLGGAVLNVGLAPHDEVLADRADELVPGRLKWELLAQLGVTPAQALDAPVDVAVGRFALEVVADTSLGGKQPGVVRLRLPENVDLLQALTPVDPMLRGLAQLPPDVEGAADSAGVALWLALSCEDQPDLPLSYIGLNAVPVIGQAELLDRQIGIGTGEPDQTFALGATDVDLDTLSVELFDGADFEVWHRVDSLAGFNADERIYQADAASGVVRFGDAQRGGRIPRRGQRIRASFRHGGGVLGNLAAGELKSLDGDRPSLTVRHETALTGGVDAETVAEAENRIPTFLTHRNRAVTAADYKLLAETNPITAVARAEVVNGLLPGDQIRAVREDVPGVVSLFVMPPSVPLLGALKKPTQRLLTDVFRYLRDRVVIGTELYVLSPEFVPIAVSVNVSVEDPATEQQVLAAVRAAVVGFLWAVPPGGAQSGGWPLGGRVDANEVLTQVARVDGVTAVNGLALFRRVLDAWAVQPAIELTAYQLPELLGLAVGTGGGVPAAPAEPGGDTPGPSAVPTPVVPELC